LRFLGALAGVFFFGCAAAGAPLLPVIQKGQIAPGAYLVTLVLTDSPCGLENAAGCVGATSVFYGGREIFLTHVRVRPTAPYTVYETLAHEFCHALAIAQRLPDPCHREDGGYLRS